MYNILVSNLPARTKRSQQNKNRWNIVPKTRKIEETYNRFAAIKTMLGLDYNINRYIRMTIKMKKKNQTSKAVGQRRAYGK